MKTLFDRSVRQELGDRLDGLTLAHSPKWGRMTCGQMLAHVTDGLRMAIGEIAIPPKRGPLRFAPLRHAVIYWLPFPKGAPTAPELMVRCADDCAVEVDALKVAMERMADRAGARSWKEHPMFGRMTERDWGVLAYRHIDHHLRQFGV